MSVTQATVALEHELLERIPQFYANPLGFVLAAYPWQERGPLQDYAGPDAWQREFLIEVGRQVEERAFDGIHPVEPILQATASGHGIGKSTLVAWIVNWLMSTRPHCQGSVTANTFQQLQSKSWAAIQKWTSLCITSHWFRVSGDRMYHKAFPSSWFCSPVTCKEENSEAFAGQHAANSTSFYIFDEASAIPEKIWLVSMGGLTDGESMHFSFGNPTRNDGKFHAICFGNERNRWRQRSIDSRDCAFTNKATIAQWIADYGEDSDFVRVRVRGLPPRASDLQFIDGERVYQAQQRTLAGFRDDPLLMGFDVARGGQDWSVIRFRKGLDARTIPPIRLTGEESKDSMRLASVFMNALDREYGGSRVHSAFVDSGFGGPLVDRARQAGFKNVVEISFGAKAPDAHFANMRAYMWSKMRDWLEHGAIPKDERLEIDLTGPGFHHNRQDQLVLESKEDMEKRGLASSDDADALCLTFAQPVKSAFKIEVFNSPAKARKPWAWG
jgi:hypothetical protein